MLVLHSTNYVLIRHVTVASHLNHTDKKMFPEVKLWHWLSNSMNHILKHQRMLLNIQNKQHMELEKNIFSAREWSYQNLSHAISKYGICIAIKLVLHGKQKIWPCYVYIVLVRPVNEVERLLNMNLLNDECHASTVW